MNVLLIGGGGREHALAFGLKRSSRLGRLHVAPGNAGICAIAECVALDVADQGKVVDFCREHEIDLVVVGPEAPLVAGLVDTLEREGIKAFGPTRAAAALEGSKGFTKELCRENGIPTAAYATFDERDPALAYVATHALPVVIKADGLAAGKGVVIAETQQDARAAVEACFSGSFGAAGARVVIEEFLEGEEASFFAFVDGRDVVPFGSAQDHKRVGDGDTGPNTGGMGAYSPAPVMTPALEEKVMREIVRPTAEAMAQRGTPYRGVLYAGLMITSDGPKLIEYNARFGDPEAQVLVMRLESDLLELMLATVEGRLKDAQVRWRDEAALTVVMAAEGYPGTPKTGTEIEGLDAAAGMGGVEVFHAGTKRYGAKVIASGGRVLCVTALGRTVGDAQARAYDAIAVIDWPGGFYRRDIGWRAIARERG
ncbi:MAG: hypothetical protein RLZ98_1524 [Pseudomonadota bacterium]|jgi:phosphoribosylamine--glycine ligase